MRLPNGLEVDCLDRGETALLYREIFVERTYLQHGVVVRPGDTILDVGAHIGLASLFLHLEAPGTRILSCEPAPEPRLALRRNRRRHGVEGAVVPAAVTDAAGAATLTYYPRAPGMSGLFADPEEERRLTHAFLVNSGLSAEDAAEMLPGLHEPERLRCRTLTVSQVVDRYAAGEIGLLKIDAEKSEEAALAGIAEADWARIRQVVIELHDLDGRLERVRAVLLRHGFLVHVGQDRLMAGTALYSLHANRR
jgi:FkbM family methyltransferase